MAVVIVRCHNSACKSLPEWKRGAERRELILWLDFIYSLSALGAQPKALDIMCTSTRGDNGNDRSILITVDSHLSCHCCPVFSLHGFYLRVFLTFSDSILASHFLTSSLSPPFLTRQQL